MSEYDPLRYLELLEDYTSRETSRVRRNVSVLAFAIMLVQMLGVPLDRLSIGGVPIAAGHELIVTVVATLLLLYWSALFCIRYLADNGRRAERVRILDEAAEMVRDRKAELEMKAAQSESMRVHYASELAAVKAFLEAYDMQRRRTRLAVRLLGIGRILEWAPTAGVSLIAVGIVSYRLGLLLK